MQGIGLSPADMEVVGRVFREAEEETAACFLDDEVAARILDFRYHLAVGFNPHTAVSANGLGMLRGMVFGHPDIMNFVLTLYGKFMMRWSSDENAQPKLHANLARGCSIETVGGDRPNGDMVLTPKEIASRMSSRDDVLSLLNHNPWIAVLILSSLYPSVKITVPKGSRKSAAPAA